MTNYIGNSEAKPGGGGPLTEAGHRSASRDDSVLGAPPSNTAPVNCINSFSNTNTLRTGVDSLYLSFKGNLSEEMEEQLATLKELAKSDLPEEQSTATIQIEDHIFEVRDRGKGKFAYVIVDNWFHIQIPKNSAKSLPLAHVQISSELLTLGNLASIIGSIKKVVAKLGSIEGAINLSRIDLCVDFVTKTPLEMISDDSWITRAKHIDRYSDNRKFTGLVIGRGGDISCRLYNKSLELKKSRKFYLYDLWSEQGWDCRSPVWRLEIQYRRTVLCELGILTTNELETNLNGLWKYALTDWLRLSLPSITDGTRSRWEVHPLWADLTNATFGPNAGESLLRIRKTREPSEHSLYINGMGPITSLMAAEGIKDFDVALMLYGRRAHRFHQYRALATGETIGRYAQRKAAEKARKFNTPISKEV